MEVKEVLLPGVGLRYEFENHDGDRIGVVARRTGDFEVVLYAAADLAFVGGSLVATGGHNVLEPALLGLPVLFGPHMFNFSEAGERLLAAEAAWQVADADELAAAVDRLLADPELRRTAGQNGQAVVERHRGALAALLGSIKMLLEIPASGDKAD